MANSAFYLDSLFKYLDNVDNYKFLKSLKIIFLFCL